MDHVPYNGGDTAAAAATSEWDRQRQACLNQTQLWQSERRRQASYYYQPSSSSSSSPTQANNNTPINNGMMTNHHSMLCLGPITTTTTPDMFSPSSSLWFPASAPQQQQQPWQSLPVMANPLHACLALQQQQQQQQQAFLSPVAHPFLPWRQPLARVHALHHPALTNNMANHCQAQPLLNQQHLLCQSSKNLSTLLPAQNKKTTTPPTSSSTHAYSTTPPKRPVERSYQDDEPRCKKARRRDIVIEIIFAPVLESSVTEV